MNANSGLTDKAIRNILIGLAAHQLELEHEQDGDLTLHQQSAIRTTLYGVIPTQEPGALAMWWDTVVSQTKIRADIVKDPTDACFTYARIEFSTPVEWTQLDNEAIRDRDDAIEHLIHPKPIRRLLTGKAAR